MRLPKVSQEEMAEMLGLESGEFPSWARVLATSLPKTTLSMLELDAVHRMRNPLGTELAARLRLAVAAEMDCPYAAVLARHDLYRVANSETIDLMAEEKFMDVGEAFARRLTSSASHITDAEFQRVVDHYGVETTVAIVHTVAYANFQNRLFCALGLTADDSNQGVVQPVRVEGGAEVATPARPDWESIFQQPQRAVPVARPKWSHHGFAEIELSVQSQMDRVPRVPLPPDELIDRLPEPARSRARRVVWSAISMGYQPQLTRPWFETMRTFQEEAQLDRVFSNSMFWVVTRTSECFY
ncbi:MAG TPA: hypothetical protein PKD54_02520 [Pirellulaceae bacterium]|nr:hypothetical protein [Pirellulaceae bacterium]